MCKLVKGNPVIEKHVRDARESLSVVWVTIYTIVYIVWAFLGVIWFLSDDYALSFIAFAGVAGVVKLYRFKVPE